MEIGLFIKVRVLYVFFMCLHTCVCMCVCQRVHECCSLVKKNKENLCVCYMADTELDVAVIQFHPHRYIGDIFYVLQM